MQDMLLTPSSALFERMLIFGSPMPSSVVDYQASLRARADALTLAQWLATADPETLFPNREEFEQAGESHASDPEVIDWLPFDGSGNGYAIRLARDLFMA